MCVGSRRYSIYLCPDFMIWIESDRFSHPVQLYTVVNPLSVVPTIRPALAALTPESTIRVRELNDNDTSSNLLGTGEVAPGTLFSQTVANIQTVLEMKHKLEYLLVHIIL